MSVSTRVAAPRAVRGWLAANSSGNVGAVIERGFAVIRNQIIS